VSAHQAYSSTTGALMADLRCAFAGLSPAERVQRGKEPPTLAFVMLSRPQTRFVVVANRLCRCKVSSLLTALYVHTRDLRTSLRVHVFLDPSSVVNVCVPQVVKTGMQTPSKTAALLIADGGFTAACTGTLTRKVSLNGGPSRCYRLASRGRLAQPTQQSSASGSCCR
jgi:hypothetical protein